MSRRIAVIGGGIAGLAAAFDADRAGADVTLFEAEDRVGGKIQTSTFLGQPVNDGPDAFLARVPDAIDLCRELGLESELVAPDQRSAYLFIDGALRPIPQPMVLGVPLAGAPLTESGALTATGAAGLATDLARTDAPPDHGDSVGRLVRTRMGDEILERLVDPLLGGINAGDADRLSLAASAPQLAAAANQPSLARALAELRRNVDLDAPVFFTVSGGLARLTAALAEALGDVVQLGSRVERIEPSNSSDSTWSLRVRGNRVQAGRVAAVDDVIVATPAAVADHLLAPIIGDSALSQIEYAGVVLIAFAFSSRDVPRTLDGSGFLVPKSEGLLMTATTWSSAKWQQLDDGEHALLRVSAGRFGDTRALDMSDDEVVAAARADLETTMGITAKPTAVRITRWPASFPQYTPGHLERITTLEAQVAQHDGLHLAGAAYRGVGIPACIRSGRAAAARALGTV